MGGAHEIEATLAEAFRNYKTIVLRSRLLRDRGEEKLEIIVDRLLQFLNRHDLAGPIYAAVRELVQNASKANLKRILFEDLGVDPDDDSRYQEGMQIFRRQLIRTKLKGYAPRIVEKRLYFKIRFEYSPEVIVATVRNPFELYEAEEARIRQKFVQARGIDNLYDFYLKHGDTVEGAGMGIAMVLILLNQAGFASRCLSIFTDRRAGETVSRMILPLREDYRPPRERFVDEQERRGVTAEALRDMMTRGEVRIPIFENR